MKYKSEACEVLYEHAVELYKIGVLTEARMHEYDEMCLKKPNAEKPPTSAYADEKSATIKHISHATA